MVAPRIPYTDPFPPPTTYPRSATTLPSAIAAVSKFLSVHRRTLLLTGAGISVASGLADYRGENGTYRLKRHYRPIFFSEFVKRHEARQRYWARSFLGWPTMEKARPNAAHLAIGRLWDLGVVERVVTQSSWFPPSRLELRRMGRSRLTRWRCSLSGRVDVDSLHIHTPPVPPLVELHGTLRTLKCLTCHRLTPRRDFQKVLARLNPLWAKELDRIIASGALEPSGTKDRGNFKTNPDGDYDLPNAPFHKFRYPPCMHCLSSSPGQVRVDNDGGHLPEPSDNPTIGVLKPSVTFFGESVDVEAKETADAWVTDADAVLVLGSSLATYSAWRLVRDADKMGKGVGIVNLGGVRGEDVFFGQAQESDVKEGKKVRVEFTAQDIMVGVLKDVGGDVEGLEEARIAGIPGDEGGLGG